MLISRSIGFAYLKRKQYVEFVQVSRKSKIAISAL